MRNRILETEKYLFLPVYWCFVLSLPPGRGGRLGDGVSSQTQAIQSIAEITVLFVCRYTPLYGVQSEERARLSDIIAY